MSLLIGMTTCRRPEPYVQRSIASLRAAGFSEHLFLFAEPEHDVRETPADTTLVVREQHHGCFPNWKAGANHLAALAGPGDWVLMLQDDVVYRRDASERLRAGMADFPDVGFLSLYTSPSMVPDPARAQSGWIDATFYNRAFWGALALAFPIDSLRRLLEFPRFLAHDHHRKVDVLVGNCLVDMGLRRMVHAPSLADHIGAFSTLGRHLIAGIQWGRRGMHFRENP